MKKRFPVLVYFILSIIGLMIALNSCMTERKRQRICNSCPVKTEKHDSIVYKIDSVKIQLPGKDGPTVYLENPCKLLCDSLGKLKNVDIKTKRNGQSLKISTQGNGINISSNTSDTTVKAPVISKESHSSEKNTVVIEEKCKRDHRTDFDGVCRWFFYIVAPMIGLYVFLRIKKFIP